MEKFSLKQRLKCFKGRICLLFRNINMKTAPLIRRIFAPRTEVYIRASAAAGLGALISALLWAAVQCVCYFGGADSFASLMGIPCLFICYAGFSLICKERRAAGYFIVLLCSFAGIIAGQYLGECAKVSYLILTDEFSVSLTEVPAIVNRTIAESEYIFSALYNAALGIVFSVIASVPLL